MKIVSIEVSPFTYSVYCNLLDNYENNIDNPELNEIIDEIGFNIDKPIALGYDNQDIFVKPIYIAKDEAEQESSLQGIARISKLGKWSTCKYSQELFSSLMKSTFSHSAVIDYTIGSGKVRRIMTMSTRLETVQMVEFILADDSGDTTKWIYTNSAEYNNTKNENNKKMCELVYDFNLEHFEETDDFEIWNHPLFQYGKHII